MTEQFDPPNPPPAPRQPGIQGLFSVIEDEVKLMERSVAGFVSFYRAYQQAVNGVQPNERAAGLPILASKASATGKNSVDVITDLRDMDPAQAVSFLQAAAMTQGRKILQACEKLSHANQEIYNMVGRALQGTPDTIPQAPQPVVGPVVAPQQVVDEVGDEGDYFQDMEEEPAQPPQPVAPPQAHSPRRVVRPERRSRG